MTENYFEEEIKDELSFIRISELIENPIKGNFDLEHLKKINAYIFQDSPENAGKFRSALKENEIWYKKRPYPGYGKITVCYSQRDSKSIEEAEKLLSRISVDQLKKLNKEEFAKEITHIYKNLDYFHPFPDGNSRTLREFTRSLSKEVGFKLDWTKPKQIELYLARDFEVNTIFLSKNNHPTAREFIQNEISAITYHPEYKPLEKIISSSLSKLEIKKEKSYSVDFKYNKELSLKEGIKTYEVWVNGTKANELLKKEPELNQALEGLAQHKDIKEKGISVSDLKSGHIQPKQLPHEFKVNRPEARIIDLSGNKINNSKSSKKEKSSLEF